MTGYKNELLELFVHVLQIVIGPQEFSDIVEGEQNQGFFRIDFFHEPVRVYDEGHVTQRWKEVFKFELFVICFSSEQVVETFAQRMDVPGMITEFVYKMSFRGFGF